MNILEKIVVDKRQELVERKETFPLEAFKAGLTPSDRDFKQALVDDSTNRGAAFILECKKASPSKGLIRPVFDLDEICQAYGQYASCVSVLTDEKYFQGEFERLPLVREKLSQPVLCKDFFVETYQVYLARHWGANAILLMLSVLNDEEYKELEAVAKELGLAILTEVSNSEEMVRAVELKAEILGINNRNLRDLSTDLNQTPILIEQFQQLASDEQQTNTVLISESGIYTHDQVKKLNNFVNGYLVGSSLMAQDDLLGACRDLIQGEHKVCGMTRVEDVEAVADAGAKYAGLIFVEKSPRNVSIEQAQSLIAANSASINQLQFVAVVQNKPLAELKALIEKVNVSVVQLHGDEDQAYVDELKVYLDESGSKVQIWKAMAVTDSLPEALTPQDQPKVDRILLDTKSSSGQTGGTGEAFNWSILKELNLDQLPVMLAGGLSPDNVADALSLPVVGFDLNSGVEDTPGVKSAEKISQAFAHILPKELYV